MKRITITLKPETAKSQDMTIRKALSLALISEEARKIVLLGFTQVQRAVFEKYRELFEDVRGICDPKEGKRESFKISESLSR